MDVNPFLSRFLKEQQSKMPALTKVTTTGTPQGTTKQSMGIREFAKSKPSGKDVEKWFKAKIERLEQSDSDT